MSFNKYVTSMVTATVDKLVKHLSTELGSDEEAIKAALDSFSSAAKTPAPKTVTKKQSSHKCPFEGKEGLCDKGAKTEFAGEFYCSAHAKIMEKRASKDAQPKAAPKTAAPKSKSAAKKTADDRSEDLVSKVQGNTLSVKKNSFGNYENVQHRIVFDPTTRKVLGNQLPDGKIGPLTENQKKVCQAHNLQFDSPPKTSAKAKTAKVEKVLEEADETLEEVKPPPKKSAPKTPAKPVPKKPTPKAVELEDENLEDIEALDEEPEDLQDVELTDIEELDGGDVETEVETFDEE